MDNAITILFSLLCISTVIYSAQSTESDSKYDITKLLNNSINKIFQNIDSASVVEIISQIEHNNASTLNTQVAYDEAPFNNTFYITDFNVSILDPDLTLIAYDFFNNKMVMNDTKFTARLEGYVRPNETKAYGFIRILTFRNFSITATQSNNLPNGFKIDISYDQIDSIYLSLNWFDEDLLPKQRENLHEKLTQALPSILIQDIKQNQNFLKKLNRTFCKLASKTEIALTHRDFLHEEQQYYYRAQNVSSFRITLSNITINGLSNFIWFAYDYSSKPNERILAIENVRGNANLCYNTDNTTVFQLNFQTENMFIWVNKKGQRVFVEANNYTVIETKVNTTLTKRQSEWIMEGIGRSIAASLMPSMKICRSSDEVFSGNEAVHPIVQLFGDISEKFHWSSLNESFNNWTPFNGSYTATNLAFYPESHNYSISIHNLTISPEIKNQYPYQIECHFFKMLQIIYNVDGNATGQVLLRNTTDEVVEIDFLVRFSFDDQLIRRKPNNNYEFKLWLAYYRDPFIVELLPKNSTNSLSEGEKCAIIKQINETLLSMTRQIMLHNAEPLLSHPLDFCSIPETIPNNFLPPFGDYQAPYFIPNGAIKGGQYFTAKIHNIVLNGLSNFDLARVAFNKKDVSNFDYDSTDEYIGSFVEFPIYNITGRMGFNDSSVNFKEIQLVRLNELLVANATSEGKISVFPGYKYKLIPRPDDPGFSCYDSMWIMDKLEDIIENSLMKKEDLGSESDSNLHIRLKDKLENITENSLMKKEDSGSESDLDSSFF